MNEKKLSEDIVQWIQSNVTDAGFSRVVVGLSGGVDSATSCFLAVCALQPDNVLVSMFPHGARGTSDVRDAQRVAGAAGIPRCNIQISDISASVSAIARVDGGDIALRVGNIAARVRMTLLYDRAKKERALVLGTENKSEYLLGYFTRFGDDASDLEPLRGLYKTEIFALASFLGVPDSIVSRKPTAGLWKGQTDEEELGFSYADADRVLRLLVDEKIPARDIHIEGIPQHAVSRVLARVHSYEFKHRLPLVCPVSPGR